MRKTITFGAMILFLMLSFSSAHAYEVTHKYDDGDAIYYTLSCNGGEAKIKYLKSNGGWYVAGFGASNHNYGSMDAAAKVACKYAK